MTDNLIIVWLPKNLKSKTILNGVDCKMLKSFYISHESKARCGFMTYDEYITKLNRAIQKKIEVFIKRGYGRLHTSQSSKIILEYLLSSKYIIYKFGYISPSVVIINVNSDEAMKKYSSMFSDRLIDFILHNKGV